MSFIKIYVCLLPAMAVNAVRNVNSKANLDSVNFAGARHQLQPNILQHSRLSK
jgi:hypothetical protein